ncbi:MAG TPA: universal stress protein [Burkholderiales bacterium]|jgi:nucleotide-binding universal stress UspA family protein|nr:universal stress protein [Burkholderiales bacterium]
MFKHILIPTDGSPVSAKAVKAGIAFAKRSGGRVTGYYAIEPVPMRLYGEGYVVDRQMVAEFERRARDAAKKHVEAVARAAAKAGVKCDTLVETARTPYEGIIEAARKRRCDLILMASHGYRGLMRLTLGSVTDKVIQLSKVPVLVYR